MAHITKIPCEGVIYTVQRDAYGTSIETDEVPEAPTDDRDGMDEDLDFAQILSELDELEETLAQAEEQAARAVHLDDRETEEVFLPFL